MDYLYFKWIEPKTEKKYVIGALYKRQEKYYFKLKKGYSKLKKEKGIPDNMILFNDENKIYESKQLFSIFKVRLPDIKEYTKEQLKELLQEYNLEKYNEFEMLRKTKGRLKRDNFILEGEK